MATSQKATEAAKAGIVPKADSRPFASSSKTAKPSKVVASPEAVRGATALMRMSREEKSEKPEREETATANFDPKKLTLAMHDQWQRIEDAMAHEEQLKRERAAARAARSETS